MQFLYFFLEDNEIFVNLFYIVIQKPFLVQLKVDLYELILAPLRFIKKKNILVGLKYITRIGKRMGVMECGSNNLFLCDVGYL